MRIENTVMAQKTTISNQILFHSRTFGVIGHSTMSKIPVFKGRIFWDVDFDKLDYVNEASFIITRVFDRGDVPDIRNCRRHYGDEKITEVILNNKFLREVRIYLASAVLERPLTDFRCYRLKKSNPGLLPY